MSKLVETLGYISALETVLAWNASESRNVAAIVIARKVTASLGNHSFGFDLPDTWGNLAEVELDKLKTVAITGKAGPRHFVKRYLSSLDETKTNDAMKFLSVFASDAKESLHDSVLEEFDV